MPDDKALVIPQIPVNGQLRLPGNLSGRGGKQIKFHDSAKTHTHIDFTLILSTTISTAESCLSTPLLNEERRVGE